MKGFFLLFLGVISLLACPAIARERLAIGDIVGPFGVQVKEGNLTSDDIEDIRASGFDSIRFVIPWYAVERDPGEMEWAHFDDVIEKVRRGGIKAVIVLAGGHPTLTGMIDLPKANLDGLKRNYLPPDKPESIAAFARFAAAAVQRYGSKDIVWEIWNEPDSSRFWPLHPDPEAFAALASTTCAAIRSVDPNARVIGPALAGMPKESGEIQMRLLTALMKSSAGDCLDAISVHPYRTGDRQPEEALEDYKKLSTILEAETRRTSPMPIVSTEWGYSSAVVTADLQAVYLKRLFLVNKLYGLPLSIWYEWMDSRYAPDKQEASFGLSGQRHRPKPALEAALGFLPRLASMALAKRLASEETDYLLVFKDNDGSFSLVSWTTREAHSVNIPDQGIVTLTGNPSIAPFVQNPGKLP